VNHLYAWRAKIRIEPPQRIKGAEHKKTSRHPLWSLWPAVARSCRAPNLGAPLIQSGLQSRV